MMTIWIKNWRCAALAAALGLLAPAAVAAEATVTGAGDRASGELRAPTLPDFSSLVRAQGATVVNIRVYRAPRPEGGEARGRRPGEPTQEFGQGSGFVVASDGIILTNRHVIADAEKIRVRFSDRREMPARILGVDALTDVAVLKVEASGLQAARLGNSARLEVGQWVLAIGAPLGFERTATHGIISALGRSLPNDSYVSFIQTDVPINPGNSGGPLFDQDGRVVGINSQIVSKSGGYMGLSFAIPINDAVWVAKQIAQRGKAVHGWLGVSAQELSLELAQAYGLDVPRGALVAELAPGGPAERAGLLPGDVILALDDVPIAESADLPPLIGALLPGGEVRLAVLRNRKVGKITVAVGEWGRDNAPEKFRKSPLIENEILALRVSTLSAAARETMNLTGGLLVEAVADGPAQEAGVRPGDVLVQIKGEALSDAEKLAALVERLPRGEPLPLLVKRPESSAFVPLVLPAKK